MKRLSFILCCLLLLCVDSMQAQGDFDPDPPADPQVPVFYYPLTVANVMVISPFYVLRRRQ